MNAYLQIIKPGIIFGNLISIIGGFLFASKGNINYFLFFIISLSISLIIASGCVFNNYIDCDIDKKMERTKNRVLVKGLIKSYISIFYAMFLGFLGFTLLYFNINLLSMLLAIIGFIIYVGVYSIYMKRYSIYSTIIGSFSGAMPPIISYCSVTNKFDIGACILFCIFSLWQIPHAYSIFIFRLSDYKSINIPILPIVKGILITKHYIIFYIILFTIFSLLLKLSGYVGYQYLLIIMILCFFWLSIACYGYKTKDDIVWARKLFIFSIIIIFIFNIMISIDYYHIP